MRFTGLVLLVAITIGCGAAEVTTTEDCLGVVDGDAVEDACGVCDGDGSSCADCLGVPNGDAVEDMCGVCDGDGSSCSFCAGVLVDDDADCDFVLIDSGTFTMGSPEGELGHSSLETLHQVTLTRSFYMMEHEVTQGQWQAMFGNNPSWSSSCGEDCPVDRVTFWGALAYANRLSELEGVTPCYILEDCVDLPGEWMTCSGATLQAAGGTPAETPYDCEGYRLPTEAEWEYAYRAGSTTALYNGDITSADGDDPNLDQIGWYRQNSGGACQPVKGKAPNEWGLYDMSGNLSERVWDWYSSYSGDTIDPQGPISAAGAPRIVRGGSWNVGSVAARAAARSIIMPDTRSEVVGFRLVKTAQ